MNESLRAELQDLQNLDQATLDDVQKSRLQLLEAIEQVEKTAAEKSKAFDSAVAQKEHFREKSEKTASEFEAFKEQMKKNTVGKDSLNVEDFINISTSLEGLDGREKEYAATQHKMSGKPLTEIVKDENFLLWQGAYRAKVEKDKKVISPSSTQPSSDSPISLSEALSDPSLTVEEKEKILNDSLGYNVSNKPRGDRTNIGR